MFRLSNKVVQVNFQDHTEIMLSSETKVVTYVNKRGERSTYPLSSAMESANLEMVKRLKYTKDILTHMLNQNAGTINRAGSAMAAGIGSQTPVTTGMGGLEQAASAGMVNTGSQKQLKPMSAIDNASVKNFSATDRNSNVPGGKDFQL
jgi:hypothetical protein